VQTQERFLLASSEGSPSSNSLAELASSNPAGLATAAAAALGITTFGLVKLFNQGSRTYANNVGQE